MMVLARALLVAALLVACKSPSVDALVPLDAALPDSSDQPEIVTTCDEVFSGARPGDACKLAKDCQQSLKCTRQTVRCVGGLLIFSFDDSCPTCSDDTECGEQLLCLDQKCTECPAPTKCPPCPSGLDYLSRNGCQTCECGPVPECTGPTCDSGLTCALGAYCVQGCSRLDCCANVCAEPGCPGPAPLGCAFACDELGCADGLCKAETCYCDTSTKSWQCKGFCAEDAASIIPCKVPLP